MRQVRTLQGRQRRSAAVVAHFFCATTALVNEAVQLIALYRHRSDEARTPIARRPDYWVARSARRSGP